MPERKIINLAPVAAGQGEPVPLRPLGGEKKRTAPVIGLGSCAPGIHGHRRRALLIAAAVLSVMVHALAAYAFVARARDIDMEGAGGQHEGVSLELVAGTAVESIAAASQQTAAAAAELNAEAPADAPRDQAALKDADTAPQEKPEPTPPEVRTPDADSAAAAEPQPERETPKTDEGKGEAEVRQTAQESLNAGGASSRGAADASIAAEASVAASPGEMSRYAAGLHAALIRNRPRYPGHSGSVTILFSVMRNGDVRNAEVFKTSGSGHLDQLALDAVRRVHFPPPPPRANDNQLSYTATIHFR